jgi:hypothetical protein
MEEVEEKRDSSAPPPPRTYLPTESFLQILVAAEEEEFPQLNNTVEKPDPCPRFPSHQSKTCRTAASKSPPVPAAVEKEEDLASLKAKIIFVLFSPSEFQP